VPSRDDVGYSFKSDVIRAVKSIGKKRSNTFKGIWQTVF
jgi:hypothetical protein